jgi:hypothetical protein
MVLEFREFPKIYRLNREVIVTEKLDGTNGCVIVGDDGSVAAQSRSRIITTEDDNFGFAKWVSANADELRQLGPGYHYGEWWGHGIQRNYGLSEKRFSLFNTTRWGTSRPACCHVVPVIVRGSATDSWLPAWKALEELRLGGSVAAPGFMKPEGVVAYHAQGNVLMKATLEKDGEYKGKQTGPLASADIEGGK